MDASLIGRSYPAPPAFEVTDARVRAFAAAVGSAPHPVPPTFPIVPAFAAMTAFLAAEHLDLERIVHGEQRFAYARPVRIGDLLTVTLSVVSLRQIDGADIIGTSSAVTDADGAPVCTGTATLVHRGAPA